MAVFRLGERNYQVDRRWAKLPQGRDLSNISAVSTDKTGRVYVLQRDDPFMLIFAPDGTLIDEWKDDSILDGHYFFINSDGKTFVVDRDHHRIVVLDQSGKTVQIVGDSRRPGDLGRPFNHPTDVAVSDNGTWFVTDGYGNACVHVLDPVGQLIRTWGKTGSGKGQFSTPHSVLVDKQGRVLVADRENNRIQLFDQNGNYLQEYNNLYHPMNIFEDDDGLLYVTDQTPSLSVLDGQGTRIGRCRTFGTYAHGVTVDRDGSVYIAEMFPNNVTKLSRVP